MTKRLLILLLLVGYGAAQEAETPLIFFREPDPKTEKRIEDELISGRGKGLSSGTRDKRSDARRELIRIGAWAVPYLNDAIAGRRPDKNAGIRRNAVMVLARILDPRALPALREVAAKDADRWVRSTACVTLGLFRKIEDRNLLQRQLDDGDRGAALALAKLRDSDAAAILVAAAHNPSRDKHVAAASLLAAAVASPYVDCASFLDDKENLPRRTAATCLLIRPLPVAKAQAIISLLRRPGREDKNIRAVQVHALGAVRARTPEIRDVLLKVATGLSEKNEAQIAALTELAYERGVRENYDKLRGLYTRIRGRNDPVVAACLFAMARTDEPKAVDVLLHVINSGSDFLQFYAAGSLLHMVVHSPNQHPREGEIFTQIENLRRTGDKKLVEMVNLAFELRTEQDPAKRLEIAERGFERIAKLDLKDLHLWDWSREERAWALINRLVLRIFELDDVLDKPQGDVNAEEGMSQNSKATSGASPEEEDFLDFLGERPYFAPEDLGGG